MKPAILALILLLPGAAAGAQSVHLPPGGTFEIPTIASVWPESWVFETWIQVVWPGAFTMDAGAFTITCTLPVCSVDLEGALGGVVTLDFELHGYSVHALSVEAAVNGDGTEVRLRLGGAVVATGILPNESPAPIKDMAVLNFDAKAVLMDYVRLWDADVADVEGLAKWLFQRPLGPALGLVALWSRVEGSTVIEELAGLNGTISGGKAGKPLCRQPPLVPRFRDGFESGNALVWSEVVVE